MTADQEAGLAAARAALVARLAAEGIGDERTRLALARVPRHRFVPAPFLGAAYEDQALPIGEGQTISQPRMVVLMTSALGPTSRCRRSVRGAATRRRSSRSWRRWSTRSSGARRSRRLPRPGPCAFVPLLPGGEPGNGETTRDDEEG